MTIRRPLVAALALAGAVLALTADERVFGLMADGRTMLRTAVSIATLGEIGIARGGAVDVPRPAGDAVSRYGMGPSLVLAVPALLAPLFEKTFGPGASQTLFALHQILFVLLAALAAGLLARAWGGSARAAALAALATALASPLWAYVALDFSEPLQAALCGGAFAAAAWAREEEKGDSAKGKTGSRRGLAFAASAGFLAGFAFLSKSLLVFLFPAIVAVLLTSAPGRARTRQLAAAFAAFALPALVWLFFEIVRFGRPFASYGGERFTHPPLDGLWRLLLGPNKGLVFYFPLVLLSAWGAYGLIKSRRGAVLPAFAFSGALLAAAAAWWAWDGTFGWGPRLLMPAVPILAAAAAVAPAPRAVFMALFAAGAAVNGLGALQPATLTTWTFAALAPRPLGPGEAARYPDFALRRGPDGASLYPQYFASSEAALAPIPLAARLLAARLSGAGAAGIDAALWKGAPAPAAGVADALPASSLAHLTAPFRWPRLGMSLSRRRNEPDRSLAYVEALLDQANRAQDMGRADRALEFGERLFDALPNPETATVLAEGYRLARRPEALESFAQTIRRKGMEPEFAVVLALAARDAGDGPGAAARMGEAAARSGRADLKALAEAPPSTWPATLRQVQAAAGRMRP